MPSTSGRQFKALLVFWRRTRRPAIFADHRLGAAGTARLARLSFTLTVNILFLQPCTAGPGVAARLVNVPLESAAKWDDRTISLQGFLIGQGQWYWSNVVLHDSRDRDLCNSNLHRQPQPQAAYLHISMSICTARHAVRML